MTMQPTSLRCYRPALSATEPSHRELMDALRRSVARARELRTAAQRKQVTETASRTRVRRTLSK